MEQTVSLTSCSVNVETRVTPEDRRSGCTLLWSIISRLPCLVPGSGVVSRKGSSHEVNQDCGLVPCPGFPILAVADGVSKSNRGEVASRLALMPFAMSRFTGCSNLKQLAFTANDLVRRCYGLFEEERTGQCTLVAARLKRLAVAEYLSIGDSRVYLLEPYGFLIRRYRCKQITFDQTHGERKKRVAYKQPDKYRDDMMIHAIGVSLIEDEIETGSVCIPPNGILLLATDGFFKGMGEEHCELIARLAEKHCSKEMQPLAAALVEEAAQNFDTGDDITVAVISPAYLAGARWPFWVAAMVALITCIITVY